MIKEKIIEMEGLRDFKKHPFQVKDDKKIRIYENRNKKLYQIPDL